MSALGKWNIGMSVAQLSMAIFLTVLYDRNKLLDKKIDLYGTGVMKRAATQEPDKYHLEWEITKGSSINIAAETVSFFYITSFFHGLYAMTDNGLYKSMIDSQNNYLRWIEYSISATLMVRIIAIQAGIRDQSILGLLTGNTISIMLMGQIVELSIAGSSEMTKNNKIQAIVATLVGWILLIMNFVTIGNSFFGLSTDVDNFGCEGVRIPPFVKYILISQLLFYSSFGIIQLYHLSHRLRGESVDYSSIERAYVTFSLISKISLGAILGYSVIGADQGAYGTFSC